MGKVPVSMMCSTGGERGHSQLQLSHSLVHGCKFIEMKETVLGDVVHKCQAGSEIGGQVSAPTASEGYSPLLSVSPLLASIVHSSIADD
eukprot:scaffold4908_cov103-Skeletonema_dohrnii-CCMP3373.AAC.5